jgi:hypothetical protein
VVSPSSILGQTDDHEAHGGRTHIPALGPCYTTIPYSTDDCRATQKPPTASPYDRCGSEWPSPELNQCFNNHAAILSKQGHLSRARLIDYGDPTVTWQSIKAARQAVRANPQAAADHVRDTLAVWAAADLTQPGAPFILAPDMPQGDDTLAAAAVTATPAAVPIPSIQPLTPTKAWFDAVDANPFHHGQLSALRNYAP